LRALARTRVGLGALTADRKATAPAETLVAADLDLPTDVGVHLAAEVTLDPEVLFDVVTQLDQVVVGEVLDPGVRVQARRGDDLLRAGAADAVDVGQRDLQPRLAGKIGASESCHWRLMLLRVRLQVCSPTSSGTTRVSARSRERCPGPGLKSRGSNPTGVTRLEQVRGG